METPKPSLATLSKICAIADQVVGFNQIKFIFEFGSRYGEDTIEFAKRYKDATIYAFECNTNTIVQCRRNVCGFDNIVLTEKAVCDYDGVVKFYPIDKEKTITTWEDGNQGASSLFKASGNYEVEQYAQTETDVPCVRLDSFMKENNIPRIDILWMDVQGAELKALEGLGKRIRDVKVVHCEVEMMEIYSNQPLFHEVKHYLNKHGFKFMGFSTKSKYSGDAVFVKRNCINKNCASMCKWVLIPDLLKDGGLGRLRMKFINRGLYALRRVRRFGSEFRVQKPDVDFDSQMNWYRQVVEPLIGIDVQYRNYVKSKIIVDVVIPTVEKDIEIVERCIKSIQQNLMHPIGSIFIVAPLSDRIMKMAKDNNCKFILEDTIVDGITKGDIRYTVNGLDRSGWLFQQLIKLSVDEFTQHDYVLVMDSDTVLARPVKYIHNGKMILNISDEHHDVYYEVYRKLMGESVLSDRSFVAHGMLFSKELLREMKRFIAEKNNKKWEVAILDNVDYTNISGFSEYETYGNYLLRYHPDKVKIEYWFNKAVRHINEVSKAPGFYKSISLHSYNTLND